MVLHYEVLQTFTDGPLRDALVEFFLSSADALMHRLQKERIPLIASIERSKPVRLGDSWGVLTENGSMNVLASDKWRQRISQISRLTRKETERAGQLGKDIAESATQTLPFWDSFAGWVDLLVQDAPLGGSPDMPNFVNDPGGWTARCVVLPALQAHLTAVPSVQRIDITTATSYADEVMQVAHDDRWCYQEVAPLSGIDLDPTDRQAFNDNDITLRRLSEEEQIQWLKSSGFLRNVEEEEEEEDPPLLAVEIQASSPRGINEPIWPHSAPTITAALQLADNKIGGHLSTTHIKPHWMAPIISPRRLALPRSVGRRIAPFREDDFQSAINTAATLKNFKIEEPRSVADLALHRFISGCTRPVPADALIDFTIALESLLLPYDEAARHGDLSYRFRIHGAHYLAESHDDRKEVFKKLRGIYEMRSRLVHGARYPTVSEITATRDVAYELARRGLHRAVHHGFPTAKAFNAMALGED